jgi:hypothetical protein
VEDISDDRELSPEFPDDKALDDDVSWAWPLGAKVRIRDIASIEATPMRSPLTFVFAANIESPRPWAKDLKPPVVHGDLSRVDGRIKER